jgi:hypothetical protein
MSGRKDQGMRKTVAWKVQCTVFDVKIKCMETKGKEIQFERERERERERKRKRKRKRERKRERQKKMLANSDSQSSRNSEKINHKHRIILCDKKHKEQRRSEK